MSSIAEQEPQEDDSVKTLKKKLYCFRFEEWRLKGRARNHITTHRLARLAGYSNVTDYENSDMKSAAFKDSYIPLSNEYILEMVASYLPLRDLRTCRQVCKLWAKEFQRCTINRKSLVVAYEDDCADANEILKNKKLGGAVNLSALVVLEMPFNCDIIQDLVHYFGSTLNELKLDDCDPMPTAQEVYSSLMKTPFLEHFSFKTMRGPSDQEENSILDQCTSNSFSPKLQLQSIKKFIWEDSIPVCAFDRLPEMCPNLISLKINMVGKCDHHKFEGLRWDCLQVLVMSVQGEFKVSHFESLLHLKLQLKKLSLQNVKPGGKATMDRLHAFLNTQADTLEEVSIAEPPYASLMMNSDLRNIQNFTPFPVKLNRLKSLKIAFGLMNTLAITNDLPMLTEFDSKCYFWKHWWTVLYKNKLPDPHEFVRDLSLGAIDSECLQRIALSFPNVANLEVSEDRIGDLALRAIFSSMPQLLSIKISKSVLGGANQANIGLTITDSGITGLPLKLCDQILQDKTFSFADIKKSRSYPYIGDLKELRTLVIESSSMCALTDVSIFYGIAQVPYLAAITLPKECQISEVPWIDPIKNHTLPWDAINKECGRLRRYEKIEKSGLTKALQAYRELFVDID